MCATVGSTVQLSACEVHGQSSGGAPLQAVQEVLVLAKPDIIYIPTQNATEEALVSVLSSATQGGPLRDDGSSADASIYRWPAASQGGQEKDMATVSGDGLRILPSRLFVFAKV